MYGTVDGSMGLLMGFEVGGGGGVHLTHLRHTLLHERAMDLDATWDKYEASLRFGS